MKTTQAEYETNEIVQIVGRDGFYVIGDFRNCDAAIVSPVGSDNIILVPVSKLKKT